MVPDLLLWLTAAAVGTPVAHLAWLKRRLGEPACPAEPSWLKTADGARLALYRYRPAEPVPGREPVLMISGFGLNRAAIDFDERTSWARRFAAAGFVAWLWVVRGSGRSRRAGIVLLLQPVAGVGAGSGRAGRSEARGHTSRDVGGRVGGEGDSPAAPSAGFGVF